MTHWARASWFSSLSLLFPFLVLAQTPSTAVATKITIDQTIVTSGYLFDFKKLDLQLPANLEVGGRAWVRRIKRNAPALPSNLKALSPVYSYTITDQASWLTQPLEFTFTFPGKKYKYERSYYFYNGTTQTWEKLDSTLNRSARTLTTQWGAPHALVVVAADTNDLFGPSQVSNFQDFGDINAATAIAIDTTTGDVLYSKGGDTERSMASMTKLMTAYVLFNEGIDLDAVATYRSSYGQEGAELRVSEGETMTMNDLMYAMVVGSANNAAYALVGNAGYSVGEFVAKMNSAADDLGLSQTSFADPSGLAVANTTTPHDYAKLMLAVLQTPEIAEISASHYYSFTTINYGKYHDFFNTNLLMRTSDLDITASKTGYIDEAIYCLAMRLKEGDHEIITVVMGAPTSGARFTESERLANWVFENYQW